MFLRKAENASEKINGMGKYRNMLRKDLNTTTKFHLVNILLYIRSGGFALAHWRTHCAVVEKFAPGSRFQFLLQ